MKDTLIDSFLEIVADHPEKKALIFRRGHHYETLTYADLYKQAENLAVYLKERGVKEGDRVLLLSENRPEWVITDVASMILGTILVPVHSVFSAFQVKIISDEVEPAVILVSTSEQLDKILKIELPEGLRFIIGYFENDIEKDDPILDGGRVFLFKDAVFNRDHVKKIDPIDHNPERVVTIIYTSGTTGEFKGVELTNENFISNLKDLLSLVEITEKDKFLSVLPLSHVFERTVGYYLPMFSGSTIGYVEDPAKVSEVAKTEKPTIIICVPRLLEKIYEKVQEEVKGGVVKSILFKAAFYIGRRMEKSALLYRLADLVVFKKVKNAFGGQVRFFVSGAASLSQTIGEFFDALSIPILEGYGLTETSAVIATNTIEKRKYGTVGRVLPGIRTKIVRGELYVNGPNVFKKYYKNPQKTIEAFTKDGWFKTGDIVNIDKDSFISFKTRKKEILVLSTGKKISPARIENMMVMAPSIDQAYVFGDERKHVGAIIVPDKKITRGLSSELLCFQIEKELDEYVNDKIADYEQIKKFIITKKPFNVENGQMTPSLKLRRSEIDEAYKEKIEEFYNTKILRDEKIVFPEFIGYSSLPFEHRVINA